MFKYLIALMLVVLPPALPPARAQDIPPPEAAESSDLLLLEDVINQDQQAIEALSLYPREVREAIFLVAASPDGVVRTAGIQARSSASFAGLLAGLPQEEQKSFWDVSRYPGLIDELVAGGGKPADEITSILVSWPAEIREAAQACATTHFDILVQVRQVRTAAEQAFDAAIAAYPAETRDAYRTLVGMPEVFTLLNENMSMTVLVGSLYRHDPVALRARIETLGLEAARKNAEALEDWKKELAENPEALEELKASAEDFAEEYGADTETISEPVSQTRLNVVIEPYPYWYGYPYWYPYPYWYYWGYYYGPGDTFIIWGPPSYYYTWWYFHYPYHHYRYPYLTDSFLRHNERHRDVKNGFNDVVGRWKSETGQRMGADWMKDDGHRADRLKEYGRFERDYSAEARGTAARSMSRSDYMQSNTGRYPGLQAPAGQERIDRGNRQPPTGFQGTAPVSRLDVPPPPPVAPDKGRVIITKPNDAQKLNGAKDHHQSGWDRKPGSKPPGNPPASRRR